MPKRRRRARVAAAPRRRRRRTAAIVKHHNPSRGRRVARRVRAYTGRTIGGIGVMGAFKETLPMLIGALAAKFAAKRFGGEGGAEGDNWTWKHYVTGIMGGFAAAFAASALFKGRRETANKVFKGATLLIAYKWLLNEVASKNEKLASYFGQEDAGLPEMTGIGFGADAAYDAGDLYTTPDGAFVKGTDGYWRPADESHRLPGASIMGSVERIDPRMGSVERIDPRMGGFGATNWEKLYPTPS